MEMTILVTKQEAARLLSVSTRTVDNLIRVKQLPARRIGRRTLLSRADLEKFGRRAFVPTRAESGGAGRGRGR